MAEEYRLDNSATNDYNIYGGVKMKYTFHRLPKKIGENVLKKNNFTCSRCGVKERLCVHHIERVEISDPKYLDENNMTVLCRNCHMAYHREVGHIRTPGNPFGGVFAGQPVGRRGKNIPPIMCHCGKPQHAKGLSKKHYMQKLREK